MVSEEVLNSESIAPRSFYNDHLSFATLLTQLDEVEVVVNGDRGFLHGNRDILKTSSYHVRY